jgi:hypothetical protein
MSHARLAALSITRLSTVLGLLLSPVALSSQVDREIREPLQPYCSVSSEQVVAGTSDQEGSLEMTECTERFRKFLSTTMGEVRSSYTPLFEKLQADPQMIDALSRLIVRGQLLSTGWAATDSDGLISHDATESDSIFREQTNTLLRERLTPEDFAVLQKYKESIPTRELLKPVLSRLESAGMPPSREQLESAIADIQSWAAGLLQTGTADNIAEYAAPSCEQVDEFMNGREAQLLAILSKSLDEKQASVAQAYYRELAEQREKALATYRSKHGNSACATRVF